MSRSGRVSGCSVTLLTIPFVIIRLVLREIIWDKGGPDSCFKIVASIVLIAVVGITKILMAT